jgi:hypothetical protein
MCRQRQRPGTGSDLAALMRRRPEMLWPDLRRVLDPLPWAVVGAVATRLYMPERKTAGLAVMVASDDGAGAEQRLEQTGWERVGDLAVGGSSWRSSDGVELDLLACDEPWCAEALREAAGNRDAQGFPIIPLPYLVLLRLRSSRTIDLGDLTRMLGLASDEALTRVRRIVQALAPEDSEDLEALIELGGLETGGPLEAP